MVELVAEACKLQRLVLLQAVDGVEDALPPCLCQHTGTDVLRGLVVILGCSGVRHHVHISLPEGVEAHHVGAVRVVVLHVDDVGIVQHLLPAVELSIDSPMRLLRRHFLCFAVAGHWSVLLSCYIVHDNSSVPR